MITPTEVIPWFTCSMVIQTIIPAGYSLAKSIVTQTKRLRRNYSTDDHCNANGDSSWYINSYDGKENYEDFFYKGVYAGH